MGVDSAHHGFVLMRPGDGQHARVAFMDPRRFGAETAGDDDLAVLRQRLANGVQRFLPRAVDEAAGDLAKLTQIHEVLEGLKFAAGFI